MAVFAINSRRRALITGDVTTLMIFTSGKVGIGDLFAIIGPGLTGCLLLCHPADAGLRGPAQAGTRRHLGLTL